MAKLHFEVYGTFTQNGVEKVFDNVFEAKNPNDAKNKAQNSYTKFVKSGQTGPASGFGKLRITKVEEFDLGQ